MAQLFDFNNLSTKIEILDPGAGTGILSAALLDRAFSEKRFSEIQLTRFRSSPCATEESRVHSGTRPYKIWFCYCC